MDVEATIRYSKFLKELEEKIESTKSEFSAHSLDAMSVEEKVNAINSYIIEPVMSFLSEYRNYAEEVFLQEVSNDIESCSVCLEANAIFDFFNNTQSTFCEVFLARSKYSRADIEKIMEALKDNDPDLFITRIEASKESCNLLGKICGKAKSLSICSDISKFEESLSKMVKEAGSSEVVLLLFRQYFQENQKAVEMNLGCDNEIANISQNFIQSFPNIDCDTDTLNEWMYNSALFCSYKIIGEFYLRMRDVGNKTEAKLLRRLLLHPAAEEMYEKLRRWDPDFSLALVDVPYDIFDNPVEGHMSEYFCNLKPQFIAGGSDKLIAVVSPLSDITIVDNEDNLILQTLVFRFTGRLRPQVLSLPKIAVKPENAIYIYYVVKNIVSDDANLFSKIKSFFKGHNFPENESDLELDKLPKDFKEYYDTLYSDVLEKISVQDDSCPENKVELILPPNFFALKPHSDRSEYFGASFFIAGTDIETFTALINWLGEKGYIENDLKTKRLLAYRLTGRWRPEGDLPKIKWMGRAASGGDCIYLVSRSSEEIGRKYDKMKQFIDYPFPEQPKSYIKNSGKSFRKSLNQYFPKIFTFLSGDEC